MGGCWSAGPRHLIPPEQVAGDEEAYRQRYLEDEVLGEGQFGVVRLVHDVQAGDQAPPLACKLLRKGLVFKDNTLYTPIHPAVLAGEIDILRTLQGAPYCLQLVAVYESTRCIYVLTEYCAGGDLTHYLAHLPAEQELSPDQIATWTRQLFTAVHHSAAAGILHRDIKPDNIMMTHPLPGADLRLIDFGSGCHDHLTPTAASSSSAEALENLIWHSTYAGSAFYCSPEMFQRTYTSRTDVWSAGVTLYVLVAGYPGSALQAAFNTLHQPNRTRAADLQALPHMPPLPTPEIEEEEKAEAASSSASALSSSISRPWPLAFYDFLHQALTYRHKQRPSAGQLLQHEFLQQPSDQDSSSGAPPLTTTTTSPAPTSSSSSLGQVQLRHTQFLHFVKFERSLTTLLAALLTPTQLQVLLQHLSRRCLPTSTTTMTTTTTSTSTAAPVVEQAGPPEDLAADRPPEQNLSVVRVGELKDILQHDMQVDDQVLEAVSKLPHASDFHEFAYHVALLREFSREVWQEPTGRRSSRRLRTLSSSHHGGRPGNHALVLTDSNGSGFSSASVRSDNQLRRSKRRTTALGPPNGGLPPAGTMRRNHSVSTFPAPAVKSTL